MIPAELRALKGWLVWKSEQKPGEKKPRKVPHYVDGTRRRGVQGSPEDRARWATYDDAARIVDDDLTGEWGLGLAMSPEWGIVGLDFDACVDAGEVNPEVESVINGTYSELSPSGRGVHAFLVGKLPDKKSRAEGGRWGFETFCANGFLTVTGHATPLCELVGWDSLDHVNGVVTDLFEARFGGSAAITVREPGVVEGLDEAELRRLLTRITPNGSYLEWVQRGMALYHETGGSVVGLDLWDEHSAQGVDYAGRELIESKWASFERDDGPRVTAGYLRQLAGGDPDAFDDVSGTDDRPPLTALAAALELVGDAARGATLAQGMGLVSRVVAAAPPPIKRRGIPEAHHLTTDQANANRLVNSFGRRVFVAASRWHVWDGRRWIADEADVYRYGCQLSELIRGEAQAIKARASVLADMAAIAKADEVAKSLMAWALRSEMKGTIEAAIGLARKMLTVDESLLDRDPWALNCLNGVVDLRTGRVRPHNPDDLITKLVPVAYVEGAACPTWDRVLGEITLGNAPLAEYLQRWFGYCLTASVVEQVFVVHWGGGSNGKSTVLGLMAETLGDYASTAPPGLMAASKGERHPTEIASLMGRRQVTAHESGEGVVLREDFIKQATGEDRLEARFMRGDFFGFNPTHKLQLLTNHKPQIKGQDHGIWRRVHLVPYPASFGTEAQVLAGSHTHVRDLGVVERLQGELEGVLAWRVRGAMQWAAGGLAPPDVVLSASAAYKAEQDRVGQFVGDCCERGPVSGPGMVAEALTEGMGGLYPAYVSWCRDGGTYPLSKARFTEDALRVAGVGETVVRYSSVENGKRRKTTLIPGIRLLPD